MKALPLLALSSLSLLPLSSHAIPLNDDFALLIDLTLASDYRTRGISQTQNDPAVQAGAAQFQQYADNPLFILTSAL